MFKVFVELDGSCVQKISSQGMPKAEEFEVDNEILKMLHIFPRGVVVENKELVLLDEWEINRLKEYTSLNQFEMIFDDRRDGTSIWEATINDIKSRHPKDNE
jgi:hypothetical protein